MHSAMEPGDSVLSPIDIIRSCVDKGFPGCAIIGGSRLLALNEAVHAMHDLGLGRKRGFKLILGIEIKLKVGHVHLDCVLLARNREGWAFLRDICTRPLEESGIITMGLGELSKQKGNLFLLIRPMPGTLQPSVLKACVKALQVGIPKLTKKRGRWIPRKDVKQPVPSTYLVLGEKNRDLERLAISTGLVPLAAPDIHCLRPSEEQLVADWRAMHKRIPIDPAQCMTLTSISAVVQRFDKKPKLMECTRAILDAIEDFDLRGDSRVGQSLVDQLSLRARNGLNQRCPPSRLKDAYKDRLTRELSEIVAAGLVQVLLQLANLVGQMRRNRVPVDGNRGNLSCSLVAWALRITDVDPIREKLPVHTWLRSFPERKPMVTLGVGSGGEPIVQEYLCFNTQHTCRALQITKLGLDDCALRLATQMDLTAETQESLLTAIRKPRPAQDPGSSTHRRALSRSSGLRRIVVITSTLAKLPGAVSSPSMRFLINTWERPKIKDPVAPIMFDGASALGYLPVDIVVDPELDEMEEMRSRLDPQQLKAVEVAMINRDHREALVLAIKSWERNHLKPPSVYFREQIPDDGRKPHTFEDLVALHGFRPVTDENRPAMLTYFNQERADHLYYFYKHPHLRNIMQGTRGQILFHEQCEALMVWGLKIPQDQTNQYLMSTDDDPAVNRVRLWMDSGDQIVRRAWVPTKRALQAGMLLDGYHRRSGNHKKLYRRNASRETPSMSRALAKALHQSIAVVLGRTNSKAMALGAALRSYERALLETV
jgi:hypothetical protein